jgi:hypothetical protein
MNTLKRNMASVGIVLTWMAATSSAAQQQTTTPQAHAIPEATMQFLKKIDEIASAASFGSERLMKVWPASNPTITEATTSRPITLAGGRDRLDAYTTISASMIKLSPRNPQNVGVASLSIEGICVIRKDLEQHYPDLTPLDASKSSTVLGAYGSWGLKRFTFNHGNPCLVEVAFEPSPIMPKAFLSDSSEQPSSR